MMNFTSSRLSGLFAALTLSGLSFMADAQSFNWSPAGPIYNAGRARNMVVDYKTNPNGSVLYVGSSTSGIFRSTDAGSNWSPINDQSTVRNISYMAQGQDGVIYAGTGEGFLRPGQKASVQTGTGLYKLNGNTNNLELVVSHSIVGTVINRVACSPILATHIALATNKGIYVSTDGQNFNPASGFSVNPLHSGMDVKFDANGILYCSVGSEVNSVGSATTAPSLIYKSTDNGLSSFTNITPPQGNLTNNNYGRIELAVSPTDPNYVYASIANKMTGNSSSATLKVLYVSTNAGQSWTYIIQGSGSFDPFSNGATIATGDYAQVIKVHPTNKNVLFVGGFQLYTFTLTNVSAGTGDWKPLGQYFFSPAQNYLHENVHDVQVVPGSGNIPQRLYVITDAGVYRSSAWDTDIPTFQPFYKGLVTGQFNSVSPERFPVPSNTAIPTQGAPGSSVNPFSGFVGGTAGNGLNYFSGTATMVTQENSYIGGEIYNAEFSKILPNAVYASNGAGRIFRSTNIRNSPPTMVNVNNYTGPLSRMNVSSDAFENLNVVTGTPFRLWEYYGQTAAPDSMFFYNDSLRIPTSVATVSALVSATSFTFLVPRPNKKAMIDSVTIRTGTVQIAGTSTQNAPNFSGLGQLIRFRLPDNYVNTNSVTILTGSANILKSDGPFDPANLPVVRLNNTTNEDDIVVTFSAPPFATRTQTAANTNHAEFYRVWATVYYKYQAGDTVTVTDNNITTKNLASTFTLPNGLRWQYGITTPYSVTINTVAAVPNPTYYTVPAVNSSTLTGNVLTIPSWFGQTTLNVIYTGNYTLNAAPVVHTLVASTNTAAVSPTYILMPDNIQQPTGTFTVSPATATNYTITETDGVTITDTYSTIGTPTYVLNPGNISQTSPVFAVTPTMNATSPLTLTGTNFVIQGVSSNTLTGDNTSISYSLQTAKTQSVIGESSPPRPLANAPVAVPAHLSARLAMIVQNPVNTGNQNAIVVAKNPLSLNEPLSLVRVSQSGCWTDNLNGTPSFSTITIQGKPILLEWSRSGTEIYFATDQNKVYRVSHITRIMDLSNSSMSGKFFTDIFRYTGSVSSTSLNPNSPYRTTLIGSFDRKVTSISVSNDNARLVLTFAPGTSTSTAGTVMYSDRDVRTNNSTNIVWEKKETGLPANINTYSSLIEKNDSKRVFVGTDNGIYFTSDISAGSFSNINNNQLPNVQIFDIEQQTMEAWDAYNSGQIYVATNGRGVWTNNLFFAPFTVGVEESSAIATVENNLVIFPNPAGGIVNVAFTGTSGEKAVVNIVDINGRTVKTENLGHLEAGDQVHTIQTSDLSSGIYILQVSSDAGIRRVSKLILTR